MAMPIPRCIRGTLKNYSLKRTLKEQENPPEKRLRVEEAITETAPPTLKRTIKDYFNSASSSSLIPSSSPRERSTPPSSPPGYRTEGLTIGERKGNKRRRLTTYSNTLKLVKMSPKKDEFYVGSPEPISFLRDVSPSPAPRQGLSRTRAAEARRERRGESNTYRTPAALAGCQDLLADVVDWRSDSSSDVEKMVWPGAIDIPLTPKGMSVSQTPVGTDNLTGPAPQPTSETSRTSATDIMNTDLYRPAIAVQSTNSNTGALVQTQINLGGQTNATCQICHFSFNPTLARDRELHEEYHQNFDKGLSTNGLKPFPSLNVKKLLSHINPDGGENFIVLVHRRSNQCWKNLATTVLAENVDRDLGTQAINEGVLWSTVCLPVPQPSPVVAQGSSNLLEHPDDRFKVYMYVKHFGRGKSSRVIAVLLAERITHGFESRIKGSGVGSPRNPTRFEDVSGLLNNQQHKAVLGVNKIWVNKRYRRRGLATTLFDMARADFIFGHPISRLEVAWTCPTEEGAKFAKECLKGKAEYDFLSYTDK